MIHFVLRARKAVTRANFNLDSLPKEGKMDIVCEVISNALFVSDDVRRDTIVHAVMEGPPNGPRTVTLNGKEITGFRSDERSIALIIKEALSRGAFLELNKEVHVRKGVSIAKKSFERLVWELSQENQLVYLDQKGDDIRNTDLNMKMCFILGDYLGLPDKTKKLMVDTNAKKMSLGPVILYAAHCPVIINNEFDRRFQNQ